MSDTQRNLCGQTQIALSGDEEWDANELGLQHCRALQTLELNFCTRYRLRTQWNCFTPGLVSKAFEELFEESHEPAITVTFNLPSHGDLTAYNIMETMEELDGILAPYLERGLAAVKFLRDSDSLNAEEQERFIELLPSLRRKDVVQFW